MAAGFVAKLLRQSEENMLASARLRMLRVCTEIN